MLKCGMHDMHISNYGKTHNKVEKCYGNVVRGLWHEFETKKKKKIG